MKKSILLFAVALGMLTACDPIKEEGSMAIDSFTASSLLDGAQFSQYADQACTTPQSDGNWIKYSVPKASSVYIYYLKADGSEFKLASGSSAGVFNFVPARGSDPLQTVYFRYQNAKGEETVASVDFTVQVASELKPEIRLLVMFGVTLVPMVAGVVMPLTTLYGGVLTMQQISLTNSVTR